VSLKEELDRFQMLCDAHAELLEVKTDFEFLRADIERLMSERDQALAKLEAARTALAWYADVGNYDEVFAPGVVEANGTWHVDGGNRARAALAIVDQAKKASEQ